MVLICILCPKQKLNISLTHNLQILQLYIYILYSKTHKSVLHIIIIGFSYNHPIYRLTNYFRLVWLVYVLSNILSALETAKPSLLCSLLRSSLAKSLYSGKILRSANST